MIAPSIVWFRRDLRLADHPALTRAIQGGGPILPVFILDDDARPWGGASQWWLHHSLTALAESLAALGAPLLLRRGRAIDILPELAARWGVSAVHWNRRIEPAADAIDRAVAEALGAAGVTAVPAAADVLFDPEQPRGKSGQPLQVFTPFWRCCLNLSEPASPLPAPVHVGGVAAEGDRLDDWTLLPTSPDWSGGFGAAWVPGEAAAQARLGAFLDHGLAGYSQRRDRPDQDGTSRLSPHLAFGELSPRQVWHAARMAGADPAEGFLRELGWREFCYHTLSRLPDLASQPQRPEFAALPWSDNQAHWQAFIQGRTGYPIVDAGLRALWHSGWMHNRLRMIVGSFLVKDLLLPWQRGEAWFWDTLVDADPASNAAGWQWVSGCGIDAAPYFRVFNPVLQGEKFDPRGHYVRRWLPELAGLPDMHIHRPWEAPPELLARAGVRLGQTYPLPIVDHGAARRRALQAFAQVKGG